MMTAPARSIAIESAPDPTPASSTRAREDVRRDEDGPEVLRVDHLCAAWHPDHDVGERRAQHEIPGGVGDSAVSLAGLDLLALRPADHVVVLDHAGVGLERPAGMKCDEVSAVLPVDEQHPFAGRKRAAPCRRCFTTHAASSSSPPEPPAGAVLSALSFARLPRGGAGTWLTTSDSPRASRSTRTCDGGRRDKKRKSHAIAPTESQILLPSIRPVRIPRRASWRAQRSRFLRTAPPVPAHRQARRISSTDAWRRPRRRPRR